MAHTKAKAVGIYHVALEVGDIDAALEFYGHFLDFEIESRSETAAFIYFGDQFINFSRGRRQTADDARHFGIAVDDKELARETLEAMGVEFLGGGAFWISSIRGATASRSPPTSIFSSPRQTTC
jgi:lactoylglutathione lyase